MLVKLASLEIKADKRYIEYCDLRISTLSMESAARWGKLFSCMVQISEWYIGSAGVSRDLDLPYWTGVISVDDEVWQLLIEVWITIDIMQYIYILFVMNTKNYIPQNVYDIIFSTNTVHYSEYYQSSLQLQELETALILFE